VGFLQEFSYFFLDCGFSGGRLPAVGVRDARIGGVR